MRYILYESGTCEYKQYAIRRHDGSDVLVRNSLISDGLGIDALTHAPEHEYWWPEEESVHVSDKGNPNLGSGPHITTDGRLGWVYSDAFVSRESHLHRTPVIIAPCASTNGPS